MFLDPDYFDSDTVIFALTSFLIGFSSIILYNELKNILAKRSMSNDEIIREVLSTYSYKMKEFASIVSELGIRVDILEAKISSQIGERPSINNNTDFIFDKNITTSQHHSLLQANVPSITPQESTDNSNLLVPEIQNDITNYILNLLVNGPRTSRDIQMAIGRTREHTSRTMKKLYERNLITRDINNKPFTYHITDAGRKQLMEHHKINVEKSDHTDSFQMNDSQLKGV